MDLDMLSIISVLLVFCVSDTFPAIISTPGIQRINQWGTCTFQWTVSLPLPGYTVYNSTTGSNLPLSTNANYAADPQTGIVTLTISSIQLKDAGNYTLSVSSGAGTQTDSSALLFVYGYPQGFVNQTAGPVPATQGQTVELTCTMSSTSLPGAYRPKTIYYTWYISQFGSYLKNISSGPAVFVSGNVLNGYSIKNDGRTLVIDSVQYLDTQNQCRGQEDGSTYAQSVSSNLQLRYQPYTTSRNPASRKFNADLYEQVSLIFSGAAYPSLTSQTNWSFVDRTGQAQNLPPTSIPYSNFFSFYLSLTFNFTSPAYYGSYSVTITNAIGSTTETFQVLPKGPPDAPSNFQISFVTHVVIVPQWNTMWDNGYQQTIFLQINAVGNATAVAKWNTTLFLGSYNATFNPQITNNIQPDTDYEVRIWSTNAKGSSSMTKLTTRTTKQVFLYVSSDTISLNGSQAIIKYTTSPGNLTSLYVYCCLELNGNCNGNSFDLSNSPGQVIFDNLLNGNDYIFGFYAYVGNGYYSDMVLGIRVSRTGSNQTNELSRNALLIAVIVLAILLGLALIGYLVVFLVRKCRNKKAPTLPASTPKQTNRYSNPRMEPRAPQPTDADSVDYESVDVRASRDEVYYTSLD